MAELKTKIILRNDSSDNWESVKDTAVLLKGEVGIEFDGNGATSGETASKTFTYDRNAPLSANGFVRTGYTFGGWTLDKDGAGTVYADKQSVKNLATGSEQNKEIVLYAVWNANTYTVVFVKNHGTGSMESQQLTYDQETTLNVNTSITRSGYTFLGWDTDLNAVTPTYPQTKDVAGNVVGAAGKNLTPIPNGSVKRLSTKNRIDDSRGILPGLII